MEPLVALLMLAAASHGGCLVDTAKYVELITTTDNYKMVETLKGEEATAIKKAIDATPPPMNKIEAMEVDRIYVMGTPDIPIAATLIYSKKGCLQTVLHIAAPLYVQLRKQVKSKPGI